MSTIVRAYNTINNNIKLEIKRHHKTTFFNALFDSSRLNAREVYKEGLIMLYATHFN